MRAALDAISLWAMPVLLVLIPLVGIIRKVKVYDVFIEGAKEGFDVAVRIIPFLVAILVAIGMFRGSGAMDLLLAGLRPLVAPTGFPPELVPLARQRIAGVHDRSRQDARRRLADRAHGGNHVRIIRDDVLCAGGLFRRGWHSTDAPRRTRRARRRRRRGHRRGRRLHMDVLNRHRLH
jgi:hypothetical protein